MLCVMRVLDEFEPKEATNLVVATVALGLQLKQGVKRLQAKKKTRESLHMLLGVQKV